jgi:hypothetical protein
VNLVITILSTLVVIAGSLAALLSSTLFMRLRWPAPILWFVKLFACALSPFLMLVGLLTLVAGLATGSIITSCIGVYDILIYGIHIYKVYRSPA